MKTLMLFVFSIFLQHGDSIRKTWRENEPLTWADFQAKPENSSPGGAASVVNITSLVTFKSLTRASIRVNASFYQEESWVKSEDKIPSTLAHEQSHFDIAELYARKLRCAIKRKRLTFKSVDRKIHQLTIEYFNLSKSRQQEYDSQTTRPRREGNQLDWIHKIQSELNELQDYKSNIVVIELTRL